MLRFFKDLIAIPNFPGGLLSYNSISAPNWGLNGFNEDFILYIETENSLEDKQRIALSVASEMAHYVSENIILVYTYVAKFVHFN